MGGSDWTVMERLKGDQIFVATAVTLLFCCSVVHTASRCSSRKYLNLLTCFCLRVVLGLCKLAPSRPRNTCWKLILGARFQLVKILKFLSMYTFEATNHHHHHHHHHHHVYLRIYVRIHINHDHLTRQKLQAPLRAEVGLPYGEGGGLDLC